MMNEVKPAYRAILRPDRIVPLKDDLIGEWDDIAHAMGYDPDLIESRPLHRFRPGVEYVMLTPRVVQVDQPINDVADALYKREFQHGLPAEIRGTVAIVPASDFSGDGTFQGVNLTDN